MIDEVGGIALPNQYYNFIKKFQVFLLVVSQAVEFDSSHNKNADLFRGHND